jgi:hypothetical protein
MPRYFDFRVSIKSIQPEIWRRFMLAEGSTFADLQESISGSLGWSWEHLFEFRDKAGRHAIARADYADDFSEDDAPRLEPKRHRLLWLHQPLLQRRDGLLAQALRILLQVIGLNHGIVSKHG